MAQIKAKSIEANAIDESKVRLSNDAYLKARNAGDSADVNIIKVNASDALELAAKLSDPDSSAPTADAQLANKKYVDDQVGAISIPTVFELQGNWSAATNTPALANTDTSVDNFLYYVNAAGSVDFGAGSITFAVGDWVYNVNGAWEKADNNDDVLSVNGQTGTVVLDADDISDAATTNKFATSAQLAKVDFLTVTQAVDLDDIETKANGALQTTGGTMSGNIAMGGNEVTGLPASPSATGAASKEYVDAQVSAAVGSSQGRQVITLVAQDITNQYIDLAQPILADSLHLSFSGVEQEPGVDFTESLTGGAGGVTRVSFAGDLATAGASELVAGDIITISGTYFKV